MLVEALSAVLPGVLAGLVLGISAVAVIAQRAGVPVAPALSHGLATPASARSSSPARRRAGRRRARAAPADRRPGERHPARRHGGRRRGRRARAAAAGGRRATEARSAPARPSRWRQCRCSRASRSPCCSGACSSPPSARPARLARSSRDAAAGAARTASLAVARRRRRGLPRRLRRPRDVRALLPRNARSLECRARRLRRAARLHAHEGAALVAPRAAAPPRALSRRSRPASAPGRSCARSPMRPARAGRRSRRPCSACLPMRCRSCTAGAATSLSNRRPSSPTCCGPDERGARRRGYSAHGHAARSCPLAWPERPSSSCWSSRRAMTMPLSSGCPCRPRASSACSASRARRLRGGRVVAIQVQLPTNDQRSAAHQAAEGRNAARGFAGSLEPRPAGGDDARRPGADLGSHRLGWSWRS